MSRPWAASAWARASTAKAFSSPMREKAGTTWSMAASGPETSSTGAEPPATPYGFVRSDSFIAAKDMPIETTPRMMKVFTEA